MADVRFVTENPFARVWAEGEERDRRAADAAQVADLRRQQIATSRETLRAAEESRAREAAADTALRDMAVARANPLETVVARQRPDMSLRGMTGGLDEQDVPRVTEEVRTVVAPGLPNAAAIAAAAKTPGTGRVLMDHVGNEQKRIADERKQAREDDAKFLELFTKDPAVAIQMFEAKGALIPDELKKSRLRMHELRGALETVSKLNADMQERAGAAVLKQFGIEFPAGGDRMQWYDPARGAGITRDGRAVPIAGLPERPDGRGAAEPRPTMPKIIKTEDGLMDTNTGAFATWVPGQPTKPGASRWFGPNDPDTPATPGRWQWSSPDGRALPGGPQELYVGGRVMPSTAPGGTPSVAPSMLDGVRGSVQRALQGGATPDELRRELTAKGFDAGTIAGLLGNAAPPAAPAPAAPAGGAPARGPGPMVGATEAARRAAAATRRFVPVPDPPGAGSSPADFNAWEAQYGEQFRVNQELVNEAMAADAAAARAAQGANSLAGRLRQRQAEQGGR